MGELLVALPRLERGLEIDGIERALLHRIDQSQIVREVVSGGRALSVNEKDFGIA